MTADEVRIWDNIYSSTDVKAREKKLLRSNKPDPLLCPAQNRKYQSFFWVAQVILNVELPRIKLIFTYFFSPSLLLKIAICWFRWITKRKITTGERQDPRFPTRHCNKNWSAQQRVEWNELRDGQHMLAQRDKSLHNDQLTGRRPLPHTQSHDKIKQICNCPVIETSPLWAGNDKICSPATLHSSSPSTPTVFLFPLCFFTPLLCGSGKAAAFLFSFLPCGKRKSEDWNSTQQKWALNCFCKNRQSQKYICCFVIH